MAAPFPPLIPASLANASKKALENGGGEGQRREGFLGVGEMKTVAVCVLDLYIRKGGQECR